MNNNILSNPVFWSSLLSMLIAQLLKCFVEARINHKFSFKPFITNGGMPSSHAASVTALATSVGIIYGFGSTLFVICLFFALIVFNDAINVRLETGKQAQTINEWSKILEELFSKDGFKEEHFKTLVGHTKLQVLWGIVLGIVVSSLISYWYIK